MGSNPIVGFEYMILEGERRMKKKGEVVFDHVGRRSFTAWADAGMEDVMRGVEGVVKVDVGSLSGYAGTGEDNQYSVLIDPRYEISDIQDAIVKAVQKAKEPVLRVDTSAVRAKIDMLEMSELLTFLSEKWPRWIVEAEMSVSLITVRPRVSMRVSLQTKDSSFNWSFVVLTEATAIVGALYEFYSDSSEVAVSTGVTTKDGRDMYILMTADVG